VATVPAVKAAIVPVAKVATADRVDRAVDTIPPISADSGSGEA